MRLKVLNYTHVHKVGIMKVHEMKVEKQNKNDLVIKITYQTKNKEQKRWWILSNFNKIYVFLLLEIYTTGGLNNPCKQI